MASERNETFSLENLGWRLENVVCIELLRRYHHQYAEVFYYKEKTFEVDFLVAKNGSADFPSGRLCRVGIKL